MTLGGGGGSAKVTFSDIRGGWGVKSAFLAVTSFVKAPLVLIRRSHLQGATIFKDTTFFGQHYGSESIINVHCEGWLAIRPHV